MKKKIVVCFPFIGGLVGGSHISAIGLIRNLDLTRFEPLVVVDEPAGALGYLLHEEGIAYEAAPVRNRLQLAVRQTSPRAVLNAVTMVPSLVVYLRRHSVDIVHTNDGRTHIPWGVAARLAGAKHLWHHRSNPDAFGLTKIAPLLGSRIVAVSSFAAGGSKATVIHSPFDLSLAGKFDRDECRRRLVDELGCSPSTRLIGYVGTLDLRKRPLMFVDAVAALRRRSPGTECMGLLFGDPIHGHDADVRVRADELGIGGHVRLMGFRYPAESILAGLDLLLVTAVNEPFGRTLIEAMLLGTPIVAAASGGNIEAIRQGETGILVSPDDADGFASAAFELIADETRIKSITDAAQRDALSRFGIARHVGAISAVYETILNDRAL